MHCRLLTPPLFVEMEKCRAVQPEVATVSSTARLQLLSRYLRHSKWPFLAARCIQFRPCKEPVVNADLQLRTSSILASLLAMDRSESDNRHRFSQAISPTLHASSASFIAMTREKGGVAPELIWRLRGCIRVRRRVAESLNMHIEHTCEVYAGTLLSVNGWR